MGTTSSAVSEARRSARTSQAAPAPDASGTVTISDSNAITTVIERFGVSPDGQDDAIEKVKAAIAGWTKGDDFVGCVLLRSREMGGGIAIYSQWERQGDETVPEKPGGAHSMKAALSDYTLLDSDNFSVAFTAQHPDLGPPSIASLADTPLAHFGLFRIDPANYEELIRRAKIYGPKTFHLDGLRAINFHRAVSGRFVVNFGLWNSFDHFADLQKTAGFAKREQYYLGLADFRPDFFDVVAIVSK
jgi:hypothetical protein